MESIIPEKGTRLMRRLWLGLRSERGTTLVEFAFAAWLFSMMLFGIIETTIAVYSYTFVCEAARDTCRYAIVRGASCVYMSDCAATEAQLRTHIETLKYYPAVNTYTLANNTTFTWYTPSVGPPNTTWSTTTSCSTEPVPSTCKKIGNAIKVTVKYPYTLNVPFLKPINFTMYNSSMMVISQ